MKTSLKLIITLLAFIPFLGKAQATLLSLSVDSAQYQVCDSAYYLDFSAFTPDLNTYGYADIIFDGNNVFNTDLIATIDWGDNNVTSHIGSVVSGGTDIIWNFPTYHAYNQGGTYTIAISLHDSLTQSSVNTTLTVMVGTCSGTISTVGNLDCDNDGFFEGSVADIPLIIQDANTSYNGTLTSWGNLFSNIPAGTYQITVDPNWLSANGYQIVNITPDTMTNNLYFDVQTVVVDLICDPALLSSQCLTGVVYCDGDNDGVYDSTDIVLPNAPVTLVLPNGNTHNDTTDANGDYSFSYVGMSSGGYVFIDPNWITSNGYFFATYIDTLSNLDCSNNPILNIPVICDTNALSVGCIDGYVFCDADNDGILDPTETVLSNAPVILDGANGLITVYSDSTGYFSYSGWQLSGGFVAVSIDGGWLTSNGYTSNSIFTVTQLDCANPYTAYLGVNCTNTSNCTDLWTSVTPWIGYYQNTTNSIRLNYGNNGQLAPGNYTLTLDYPSGVTPVTSSINNPNYTISGNTITWTLNSSSTWFSFTDVIVFNTPAGIPDSTLHVFSSTISGDTTDCDSINNYGTLGMLVGVSYDPNDKSVDKPLYVDPGTQDEYTYVIRFQNTGTAPAQDIYIMDTLSSNLDWNTFEVIETTHQMQLINYGNGIIRFDYPQIWLPDSTTNEPLSHGHVVYKIKELPTLSTGDVIENTAYIYFDQNPPIVTNTTKNINEILSVDKQEVQLFSLYPNPAKDVLNIKSESQMQAIRIIDLSGKTVYTNTENNTQTTIDVSNLSNGVYSIQVITESGNSNRIFIKE